MLPHSGHSSEESCDSCPFCGASAQSQVSDAQVSDSDRSRKRRKRPEARKHFRTGNYWRGIGYSSEAYCQRFSEVFRDHLLRQNPNSANCSRENPCDDCTKILTFFPPEPGRWTLFEAKQSQKRQRQKMKWERDPTGASASAGVKMNCPAGPAVAFFGFAFLGLAMVALFNGRVPHWPVVHTHSHLSGRSSCSRAGGCRGERTCLH